MGNLWFKNETENNLELYLNDVYEKECVLKTSQEEVEFIQTGIETLVQDVADEALAIFSTSEETDRIFKDKEQKTEIEKYFKRDLIDVYFPIKKGSCFQGFTDIKPSRSSIIKVGSFYEGTKNNFPDEFDFIFFLFYGREELYPLSWFRIRSVVCSCIRSVLNREPCRYTSPNGTREIYLNTEKGITSHGPANKFEFIYKNGSTKERQITVDLVPAYNIAVVNKQDWYKDYVNNNVKPKSFHHEILSAESYFHVRSSISFTEREVSFISNVLSRHHVKVYRILKFLINGHGDDEKMRNTLWHDAMMREDITLTICFRDERPYTAYSSYQIKTMMIYHHDECKNSETTDIGPCVLQVLKEMCKYKSMNEFPAFSNIGCKYGYCLVDYLQSLINTLNSIQARTDRYSYSRYKIKSVTMQYLEREHRSWLKHTCQLFGIRP